MDTRAARHGRHGALPVRHRLLVGLAVIAAAVGTSITSVDAAGLAWIPMGTGLYDTVDDVTGTAFATLTSGATTYVAGDFDDAGGVEVNNIATWDGSAFTALGDPVTDGPSDVVWSLATDGSLLYVGGPAGVMSWDPVGESWTDLGAPNGMEVYALAWYDDGVAPYLVAGGYDIIGSTCSLQWFDGTDWTSLATVTRVGNPCDVDVLEQFGDQLVVGGMFDHIDGDLLNSVAIYDGGTDTFLALEGDIDNGVHDFAIGGDEVGAVWAVAVDEASGTIYLGGDFDDAGGTTVVDLVAWSGGSFTEIGLTTEEWIEGDEEVDALVYADGALAVGGWFSLGGTLTNIGVLALDTDEWTPFLGGTDDVVYTIDLNATLGQLYVGGMFSTAHSDDAPTPVADTGGIAMFGNADVAPQVTTVSVTGTPIVGQTLTAQVTSTGSPSPTVEVQWLRCNAPVALTAPPLAAAARPEALMPTGCVAITGATASTYVLVTADAGKYIGVLVLATNDAGSAVGLDVQPTAVAATPVTTTTVPITQLPETGGHDASLALWALVAVAGGALLLTVRRRTS